MPRGRPTNESGISKLEGVRRALQELGNDANSKAILKYAFFATSQGATMTAKDVGADYVAVIRSAEPSRGSMSMDAGR